MSQAVWTGSISFGLVVIPVRLYPATEPKDVRFHLYDRRTGKRVRYERVVRAEETPTFAPEPPSDDVSDEADTRGAPMIETRMSESRVSESRPERLSATPPSGPVASHDVVRGVELPEGEIVTITDDELASLAPERSRTIEIEEFVDLAEIDPVFYEKSYHVAPDRRSGAEKPYVLLLKAMQAANMVGIGRFVLRTRPHLVAIRALESTLALETLFFGDEVRRPEFSLDRASPSVSDREIATARQLIGAMATPWVPERHADSYREELLDLLRSKTPAAAAPVVERTNVAEIDDLMSALRASVEAAKQRRSPKASSSKRAG